jgi:nitrogen fixation/metabolism regulation signal transduction histidine kinase
MYIMFLIYLIVLGICTWFGPRLVAVINSCDAKAEIDTKDAIAAFMIGLVPVVNILFVFFGALILAELHQVLKAEREGSKTAVAKFNEGLRELEDDSND